MEVRQEDDTRSRRGLEVSQQFEGIRCVIGRLVFSLTHQALRPTPGVQGQLESPGDPCQEFQQSIFFQRVHCHDRISGSDQDLQVPG
jgi:hypothetical protein